jgi:hypothetical protein
MNVTTSAYNEQYNVLFYIKVNEKTIEKCRGIGLIKKEDIDNCNPIVTTLEKMFFLINCSIEIYETLNDEKEDAKGEGEFTEMIDERSNKILEVIMKHLVDTLSCSELYNNINLN